MAEARAHRSTAEKPPRHAAGALAAFLGLSAANVLPPVVQALLYLVTLAALLPAPNPLPRRELGILAIAVAYVFFVTAASATGLEAGSAGVLRLARPCVEGFLLAHVLYKWCRICDFRAAVIVLAGYVALQFATALAMALDPALRAAFIETVYEDESYQQPEFVGALLFRGYGVSRHHLYGLALAMGLAAALVLIAASLERTRRTRVLLGAIAAAALAIVAVNARIGFVPVVVCYAAGATIAFNRFHPRHALAVVLLLVVPMATFGAIWLGDDLATVSTWLAAGIEQFGDAADGGDATTLTDLRSMLVFAPDVVGLLLGGGRACGNNEACYSDIGFVRVLQEGGVVLLALVIYLYTRLNRHIVRFFALGMGMRGTARRRAARLLTLVLHLTFLAAIVKGEAFAPNDYSRLVTALATLGLLATARARRRRVRARTGRATPALQPSRAS